MSARDLQKVDKQVFDLYQKPDRTADDDKLLEALHREQVRLVKAEDMEWDAFMDGGHDPLEFDDEPDEDDDDQDEDDDDEDF